VTFEVGCTQSLDIADLIRTEIHVAPTATVTHTSVRRDLEARIRYTSSPSSTPFLSE
jgi:hypothetical protein